MFLFDSKRDGSFPPIADIHSGQDKERMYRKDAVRHIVRDIPQRLAEMRQKVPWADWQMAVLACQTEHPDWFRHLGWDAARHLEPALRKAGVDMSQPKGRPTFVGNEGPTNET